VNKSVASASQLSFGCVKEGGTVYTTTSPDSTAPWPPRQPPPQAMVSDLTRGAAPVTSCDATCGYDPVLLVAALEEIGARRAAIEWLVDADLLCLCLV
jgi:hypothetical protein